MGPPCLAVPPPAGCPRAGCRGGWPGAAGPPAPPVCRAPGCRGWLCQTRAGGQAAIRKKDEPKKTKTKRWLSVNAWNVSDWLQTGLVTTHAMTTTLPSNLFFVLLPSLVASPSHQLPSNPPLHMCCVQTCLHRLSPDLSGFSSDPNANPVYSIICMNIKVEKQWHAIAKAASKVCKQKFYS